MIRVDGRTSVQLSGKSQVYRVSSGMVDLFVVNTAKTHSRRHPVGRYRENDLIGPIGADLNGAQVICTGEQGSLLEEVTDIEGLEADLVDKWLCSLAALGNRKADPASDIFAADFDYSTGTAITSKGVIWVSPLDARLEASEHFTTEYSNLEKVPVCYPLAAVIEKDGPLQVQTTAEILEEYGDPQSDDNSRLTILLGGIGDALFRAFFNDLLLANEEQFSRYEQQKATEHRRLQLILTKISGILGKKRDFDADTDAPLFKSAAKVMHAAGIAVTSFPAFPWERSKDSGDASGNMSDSELIDELARLNGCRCRIVTLKGKWWTTDNGPLLGGIEESGEPVALLPGPSSSYTAYFPFTGKTGKVTREMAQKISQSAFIFYRGFGPAKVSAGELFMFGIRGRKSDMWTLMTAGIITGLLGLIPPIVTAEIFGTIIPEADKSGALQMVAILIGVAISTGVIAMIRSLAVVRLEGQMDLTTQAAVWDRILELPTPFFRRFTSGDLASRSLGISMIRQIISGSVVASLLTLTFSLFNFILLFYYDVWLAAVAVVLSLFSLGLTMFLGYHIAKHQRLIFGLQGHLSGMSLQYITGINKIRMTASEDRAYTSWLKLFQQKKQATVDAGKINVWLNSFVASFPVVTSTILFMFFYWKRMDHLGIAEFIAFFTAYGAIQAAILGLSVVFANVAHIIPLYERAKPILEELPEVEAANAEPGKLSGRIDASNILFRYSEDSPVVLENLSFSIGRGEFVALVGGSGSGKSTLLRLLLGFEKPTSGVVYYDDADLATLNVKSVRKQFGVVLQDGQVSASTIYKNIVGSSSLSMDDAWEAAEMAGIAQDIREMPMGMHTVVSAGGGAFSGGQRQRLLVARALVHKPSIIFFDEATSALDNKTQKIISDSLDRIPATKIVVAHRLSTIINADTIYLLEKGKIREKGTYDELMQRKGSFYELAKRQLTSEG